jgi:hypothetical protein
MKPGGTRLPSLTPAPAASYAGAGCPGANVVPSHCNAEGLRSLRLLTVLVDLPDEDPGDTVR